MARADAATSTHTRFRRRRPKPPDEAPGAVIYLGVMLSDVREREDELGRFYAETLRHVRQRLGDPEAGAVMEVR